VTLLKVLYPYGILFIEAAAAAAAVSKILIFLVLPHRLAAAAMMMEKQAVCWTQVELLPPTLC